MQKFVSTTIGIPSNLRLTIGVDLFLTCTHHSLWTTTQTECTGRLGWPLQDPSTLVQPPGTDHTYSENLQKEEIVLAGNSATI